MYNEKKIIKKNKTFLPAHHVTINWQLIELAICCSGIEILT